MHLFFLPATDPAIIPTLTMHHQSGTTAVLVIMIHTKMIRQTCKTCMENALSFSSYLLSHQCMSTLEQQRGSMKLVKAPRNFSNGNDPLT